MDKQDCCPLCLSSDKRLTTDAVATGSCGGLWHYGIEPEQSKKEQVNHPSHYGGDTPYEVIKVLEAWERMFPHLTFSLLTCIKYIPRAGIKDSSKIIEDLEKAKWYLDHEIKRLKKDGKNTNKT